MSTAAERSMTYAEYISACLRHVAQKIRGEDVAVAVLQLFSGILLYLSIAIALDHAFALSWQIRTGMLAVALAVAVWHTVRGIIVPLVHRVNDWYVARTIDHVVPELADGMTSVLQLEKTTDDPVALLARPVVEDRVVRVLTRVNVVERVGTDRLLYAWYLLAASVVMVCTGILLNSLVFQRSLMASLARVLIPWAEIAYPTRTRIVDVRPGDDPELSKAVAGTDVTISAMVEGADPERVDLYWSTDGGKTWRRQPLKRPLTSLDPWYTVLPGVEQSFVYYLEGGDCRTKTFSFTVLPVPVVQSVQVRYEPPDYTGREPYTSDLPDIEAVEGTRVTVIARLPEPVKRAELVFGKDKRRRVPMHRVPGTEDSVQASFEVQTDDVYRIWFVLESGATNSNPPVHQIRCLKDREPVVRVVEPGRDLIDPPVALNESVPIVVEAEDDFGLRMVELVFDLPGKAVLHRETLLDGARERVAQGQFEFTVSAEAFGLQPGQELVYWAEAMDNKRPGAQKSQTQKYRIRFTAPRSPEAVSERGEQEVEQPEAEQTRPQEEQPAEQEAGEKMSEEGAMGEEQQAGEGEQEKVEDPEQALEEIARFLEEQQQEQREQAQEGPEGSGSKQESTEQSGEQQGQAEAGEQEPQPGEQAGLEQGESGEGKQADGGQGQEARPPQQGAESQSGTDQAKPGEGENAQQGAPQAAPEGSKGEQPEEGMAAEQAGQHEQDGRGEGGTGSEPGEDAGKGEEPPQGGETRPGTPGDRDLPNLPEGAGLTGTRTERTESGAAGESGAVEEGQPGEGEAQPSGGQGTGKPSAEQRPGQGQGQSGTGQQQASEAQPAGSSQGQAQGTGAQPDSAAQEQAEGRGTESGRPGAPSGAEQSGAGAGESGRQPGNVGQGEQSRSGAGNQAEGQQSGQETGGQSGGPGGQGQPGQGQQGQGAATGQGAPTDREGTPGTGQSGQPGGQGGQPGGQSGSSTGGAASGGQAGGQIPGGIAGEGQGSAPAGGGAAPVAGTGEKPSPVPGTRGAAGGAPGEGLGAAHGGGGGAGGGEVQQPGRPSPELILKELEDMLRNDRVDTELLRRLGWTREDLERFVRYLKSRQTTVPSVGVRSGRGRVLTSGPAAGGTGEDAGLDVQQVRPPREYEELVEAYSRSLSRGNRQRD